MITPPELSLLGRHGVAVLHLPADSWERLREGYRGGTGFSLVLDRATVHMIKNGMTVLFAMDEPASMRIGYVRSIQKVATFGWRANLEIVGEVEPDTLDRVLDAVGISAFRRPGFIDVGPGSLARLQPQVAAATLGYLATRPDNETPFRQLLSLVRPPKTFGGAEATQADAVRMALRAFGAARPDAVDVFGETTLAGVRLLEDAVVEHDARKVPGYAMDTGDVTGRAIFSNGTGTLEVITANKRPLEEIFGVDLIYYNRARGSIVMVQYKMLERIDARRVTRRSRKGTSYETDAPQWLVRFNTQFEDELERMRRFDTDLSPDGPYRLAPDAFFVKMVKRTSDVTSAGIVVSLKHIDHLLANGEATGPHGGLRITYDGLAGHYLRSEGFIELIRSGYVGTRGATTAHLEALIDVALRNNRGIVAAIESAF